MSQQKHKRKFSDATVIALGAGAVTGGLGAARTYVQRGVNPNKITVSGGAITDKGERVSTVFNSQREAWGKALRGVGIQVEEQANYSVNSEGKYKPKINTVSDKVSGKPLAEIHVGAHPKKTILGIARDRILGKTQYRAFSDFGPGNLETGRYYLGGKNWMRAPKTPVYDRNIVPGGDLIKTQRALKSNINVETIPTNKIFADVSKVHTTTGKPTKILLSAGTGYVWPKTLPGKEKDLEIIYKSIKAVHPEHELTILGGPHVGEYESILKTFAEKNKDKIKYVSKTDAAGMRDLYKGHHISMMAPGSTTAEIAAMKGAKPKVIGLGLSGEKHFKHNTEWFDKKHGGAEFYDLKKGYNEQTLTSTLSKLKKKGVPSNVSTEVLTSDIEKVVSTATKDFKAKKLFTKRLKYGGGALLAAGGLLALKDVMTKTSSLKRNEENVLKDRILPVAGVSMGVRAVENKLLDIKSKKLDFASLNEVKDYYKDLKSGDVIALKDKFTRGIGHPIIVVDAKGIYDWPSAEGWKAGLRAKKVSSRAKMDPDRPHRLKGKIVEAYPGDKVVRVGSLEGKLTDLTHVREPFVDASGKKGTRTRFDRSVSRELGGIYRDTDLDTKKLKKVMQTVEVNTEKGLYKYKPLSRGAKILPGCGAKGNCVAFAQGILNAAKREGAVSSKPTNLPSKFIEGLKEIKPARTPTLSKTNFLTPLLAVEGALRLKKGIEQGDSTQTAVGAGEIGAGVVINLSKRVNAAVNNIGGFVAQSVGGMPVETILATMDKLKGNKSTKYLEAGRDFLRRNPKFSKTLGVSMLAVPAAYGVSGGFNWVKDKLDAKSLS